MKNLKKPEILLMETRAVVQGVGVRSGMTFVNWRSDTQPPVSGKTCLTESSVITPRTRDQRKGLRFMSSTPLFTPNE